MGSIPVVGDGITVCVRRDGVMERRVEDGDLREPLAQQFGRGADALQVGTWMVFKDQATGKSLRCKLSAKLEETDTYVFVNRFGFKVLDRKRKRVANELQHKRASVIDSGPLFDRAFNKIAENLKDPGRIAAS